MRSVRHVVQWLLALGVAAVGQSIAHSDGLITMRSAMFERADWSALPGWTEDDHGPALHGFVAACAVVSNRATWRDACRLAKQIPIAERRSRARGFFESEFSAYRVFDPAGADRGDGLLTGYFEPVLTGRRQREGRFVYPIYAPPADLLHLDARLLNRRGNVLDDPAFIVRDRQVMVAPNGDGQAYRLARETLGAEPLDRHYRVRIDGDRIVGYHDRGRIEAAHLESADVLAWVDDPNALYVMQVQGAGRVRLPGGEVLKLAYADQNGQPFTPRGELASVTRTRSIDSAIGALESESRLTDSLKALIDLDQPGVPGDEPAGVRTRGVRVAVQAPQSDRAVDQVIDQLLRPARVEPMRPSRTRTDRAAIEPIRHDSGEPIAPALPDYGPGAENSRYAAQALAHLARARTLDRSYVFFRPRHDAALNPPGSLGVPLTAGRSIAVDPRVTPLGAPVFIEAERYGAARPLRRLMLAQDSGGAIRGAQRADLFWGSGPRAGTQALQTRDRLALWVLLPRGFLEARAAQVRTRSISAGGATDCTAPEGDDCNE